MYKLIFLFVLVCTCLASEDCVTYNFENGIENFTNDRDICYGMTMWYIENYSEVSIDPFHPQSTKFASPLPQTSCMASPMFQMGFGGTVEINFYVKPNTKQLNINTFLIEYLENERDATVNSQELSFTGGWQAVNYTVLSSYLGYVSKFIIYVEFFYFQRRSPRNNKIFVHLIQSEN